MKAKKLVKLIFAGLLIILVDQFSEDTRFSYLRTEMDSLAATTYCEDSDGGIVYEIAGTVSGISPTGNFYTRDDICQTKDNEGTLKEYYCNGTLFSGKTYTCMNGCMDGACLMVASDCTDADGDSYAIEGGACGLIDCDDTNPLINPIAAEICDNSIDDNCNNLIDTADSVCGTGTYCTDSDSGLNYEEYGVVSGISLYGNPYTRYDACQIGDYVGYVKEYYCTDTLYGARIYNCANGCLDGACLTVTPVCTDADNDTYAVEGGLCGFVDCDDSNPGVNPGMLEVCANGIDDNCDGQTDAQDPTCLICTDSDNDSYATEGGLCGPIDCDDTNPAVNPDTSEVCDNGIDDNCNAKIDSEDTACGAPMNVIVIGWDGVQRDHLLECFYKELPECSGGLPNLESLGDGAIFDFTITNGDTSTKPGWAQILTGYDAEVTGVYSLGDYQPIPEGYTVFEKLENHFGDENIVTMFISGKSEHTGDACIGDPTNENGLPVIEDLGQPWCLTAPNLDYYENALLQNSVVGNRALELLETHRSDLFFAFFLFREPDVTGHIVGENSYIYSGKTIDDDLWLGKIVNKLVEVGIGDSTIIYIVSDHGFDEAKDKHANAPFTFLATNDPLVVREGDRKDLAPTILERFGVSTGPIGDAPTVNGYSLYSVPSGCIVEGQTYLDYPVAPICCTGLEVISLDKFYNDNYFVYASGGTGDQSGYCTNCGDGICTAPENNLNCSDCLH